MNQVNDYQENYGNGWIKLFRSVKNHWIYQNDKYFKWWITLLLEVNHSDKKYIHFNDIYIIKSGQSSNSLRTWSKLLNTSTRTVSKFFSLLQKDDMLKLEIIGKGKRTTTLITIEEFSKYQGVSKRKVNANETQSKRKVYTNNNVKNDKNINIPTYLDFKFYAIQNSNSIDYKLLELKYKSWKENNWKDGNNKPIKNWKSKLLNTIPYLTKKINKYKSDAL